MIIPGWFPGELSKHTGDFVLKQVKDLNARKNYQYTIAYPELSYQFIGKPAFYFPKIHHEVIDGICLYRLSALAMPRMGYNFFLAWRERVLRFLWEVIKREGRPHLIHAHTFLGGFIAAKLSEILQVPLITTEHSDLILTDIPGKYHHVVEEAYRYSDCIIAPSTYLQNAVDQITSARKSIVIPLSIEEHVFYRTDQDRKKIIDPELITVGELTPVKDPGFLLSVASELLERGEKFRMTLVGEGQEKDKLLEGTRNKGLEEVVRFAGWKKPSEVADLMCNADIYLCSSLRETFGLAVLEAIYSGLAVVTTACGGPEDFRDLSDHFYIESDQMAFADRIQDIFQEMKNGSYERPLIRNEKKYSVNQISLEIERKYGELISST